MESIFEIRLSRLGDNYRDKKNVNRGFREFVAYDKKEKLKWLLRHHREYPISGKDVIFRDDMDFLIGYYTIVMAGVITGYLSPELPDNLIKEGKLLLNNPWVRRYYETNYPLALPQLCRQFINGELNRAVIKELVPQNLQDKDLIFESFLMLNRSRIEDDDVDTFLFLLDDGFFYDRKVQEKVSLKKMWRLLSSPERLLEFQEDENHSEIVYSAMIGFGKYISYIDEYADIIRDLRNVPYLQSTLWHLDAYWFNRLERKLGKDLLAGLRSVRSTMDSGYLVNYGLADRTDLSNWRDEGRSGIDKAFTDISYLMNPALGLPLNSLVTR